MKRPAYVDSKGNKISGDESLKFRINIYLVIGTILPVIILGFIGYQIFSNINCNNTYDKIKSASKEYLSSKNKLPSFEGESVDLNVTELYDKRYLSNYETNNTECSGKVKVTKYKDDYIYTLNLTSCKSCTTSKKYGDWSALKNSYPRGKAIVDVFPYYNYYEVETGVTDWSNFYDEEELTTTVDKTYNTRIPADRPLPEVPSDVKILGLNTEQRTMYSYQDKNWKWYDIVGDYSEYSSEKPNGYANKDTNTEKLTEWSEYLYKIPEEKEYRTIQRYTAYKYYYLDDNNQKVYYNNGKYTVEADKEKYPYMEPETTTMFRYRDKTWRWYNGQRRNYSSYTSSPRSEYKYKDEELYSLGGNSSWSETSSLNASNSSYRVEETKVQTRFQVKYELNSLPIFDKPVARETFLKRIGTTVPKFAKDDGVRVEVSYKFKYRKS